MVSITFVFRWKSLIWTMNVGIELFRRIFRLFVRVITKVSMFTISLNKSSTCFFFSCTYLILEKYTVKLLFLSTTLFAKFRLYDT